MKLTVLAQNTYLSMLTPIPMVSETILSSKTPREREREREQRESESGEKERAEREREPWSLGGQDGF